MDGRVEGEEVKAAGHAARLTILFEVGGEGNVIGPRNLLPCAVRLEQDMLAKNMGDSRIIGKE